MFVGAQRYAGGTLGFAFAAVWVAAGFESAVACVVAAGLGYGAVRLREQGGFSGVVLAREAVRRELRGRLASPARPVRPATRPQTRSRPAREPAPAVAEPATYGW